MPVMLAVHDSNFDVIELGEDLSEKFSGFQVPLDNSNSSQKMMNSQFTKDLSTFNRKQPSQRQREIRQQNQNHFSNDTAEFHGNDH